MTIDKPVIAAVNGAVAGMAFPFVLCCDMRVVVARSVVRHRLRAAWPDRRVGAVVAAAAAGRSGRGARSAVLVAAGERRGGVPARARQLARRLPTSCCLLPRIRREPGRTCSPTSLAIMKRQVYEQLHRGLGAAERESQRADARELRTARLQGRRAVVHREAPTAVRAVAAPRDMITR